MITVNFMILEKEWELRVLKSKPYKKKKSRKNSLGVTLGWKRRIDIHLKALTYNDTASREVITHELVHAYLGEMCLESCTEITVYDIEEFYCELMAKRGREILDLADKLLEYIKKHIVNGKIVL
jgi:hypothetical protein